ncbi:DUF4148 domain-containing protein [Paraburkholderia sp. BL17N1]|uniref:DUF4148 domain-containing protein n=1 Tax=Paraburkholderia sp. BL17N1 TaxID=1938798 RepID=UPI000EB3C0F1|nr:DUF4148 domain-containing protein [Paraburkholderia sp. BL17N1]RKR42954.1 uncharacterized protein DUF4148 [Paraburkholderia sp. BL17N1]
MKKIVLATAFALLASSPIASFAQTDAPATRAQVRAELADLERAGYNPIPDDVDYPIRLNNAEARLQADRMASQRQAANQSATQQR